MEDGQCPAFEVAHLTASPNSSSYPSDSAAYVDCDAGYRLSGYHLLLCNNGLWQPALPNCTLDEGRVETTSKSVLIIAICTVASVVALIIIICAVYMVTRNWRAERAKKKKQKECRDKIIDISPDFFATSQDCVGMPALVFDNINTVMRGRGTSSSISSVTTCTTSPETSQDGEASTSSDRVFIY